MATFPTITQVGGPKTWVNSGGRITNHEAFAFTLQSAPPDVGALISNVTVFLNTVFAADTTSYEITLRPVDQNLNPSGATITGNFESNGV
ncbi:MAG: hypothetical protein ACLQUY_26960 [Ktedonobacterales bacterium]